MSNKNSPLRSIDQKTLSTTPPPGARPTKFNPYTGGIIKGEEQSRYRVFLDSDEDWVLQEFGLRVSATNTATDTVSVRIPKLIIRILNRNFSPDKLRVYLAFSRDAFDEDGSVTDSLVNTTDSAENLKIVSFTTQSVTYINSNTVTREISTFVRNLINKHTMYELLQLMYAELTTADLDELTTPGANATISRERSQRRIGLFNDGLANLTVYAQVAFIPLSPVNDVDSTPFILRSPVSCSYRLTPNQLRNADLSATSLSIDNKSLIFSYEQIAIRSFQYNVLDNLNRTVVKTTTHSVPVINDIRPKRNSLRIDISGFVDLLKKFNSSATAITNAQLTTLLSSSFTFNLNLLSVTSIASVTYSGADIQKAYDVPIAYSQSYGNSVNFTEEITTIPPVLSLINGSRFYKVGIPKGSAVTGILLVYRLGSNSFVPRYYPLTGTGEKIGDTTYYTIEDFLQVSKSTQNTYKIQIRNATQVTVYPVNNFGRCSFKARIFTGLNSFVDLSKDLQNNALGYYRQNITVDAKRQLVFSQGTRLNDLLRAEVPFRVQVYIKQGVFKLIYTSPLYYARVAFTGTTRTIQFRTTTGATLTSISLGQYLGRSGYQVRLVPDGTALQNAAGTFVQTGGITHVGIITGV